MVKILSKPLDQEKVVAAIRGDSEVQVFDTDMGRDEVASHPTFFIYDLEGNLSPTGSGIQYKKAVTVMYVTREGQSLSDIDKVMLIERLKRCGLQFEGTDIDTGSLLGTDDRVVAVTFNFFQLLKICLDD